MKVLRFVLLALLILILLVGLGGFVFFWDTTRGPLPQTVGALNVEGLQAQVEILRDDMGIPHIYASNPHDLFFAQGFVQAQDRWWQMELYRHIGSGTISELTGKVNASLSNDIFIRTAGWRRAAERDVEQLSEETTAQLQAFAEGVNAYILNRSADDLAMEYRLLGLTGVNIPVQPWTIVDSVAWGKVMSWNLTATFGRELVRQELLSTVGEEMMVDYAPPYPYGVEGIPTIVHPEDLPISDETLTNPTAAATRVDGSFGLDVAGGYAAGGRLAGMVSTDGDTGIGSNNWVVNGTLTASGLAMLADDMHLSHSIPGIWYLVGLHCLPRTDECPYDLVGFALSPAPSIIVGHNDQIAWGFTNVGADVQDLYVLEWNPDNPLQYRWHGEWRDAELIEETIHFGDNEGELTIQVRETHLGPVINDNEFDAETGTLAGFNTEDPLVLRWTGNDPNRLFDAFFGFATATDWESFRAAASYFALPAQNLVFADVRGNIGYQTPGLMPIRPADHDGLTPYPADGDEDTWQGYIPFDNLPRVLNPVRNYITSANHAVAPLEYYAQLNETLGIEGNTLLSYDWAYGQRGGRIEQLLQERVPHSTLTFQDIHRDNKDVVAERIMPYLAPLPLGGSIAEARDFLLSWDFQMNAESGQAALWAYFTRQLVRQIFEDQLPDGIRAGTRELFSAWLIMEKPNNVWWDSSETADVAESRDDILVRAFTDAVNEIAADLGSNPAEWSWGELHGIAFVNTPLGDSGIDLIEDVFNRTVLGYGGGSDIVNATSWDATSDSFFAVSIPSERVIIDLADFDNSLVVLPVGQSGHPYSPHYDDMIEIYRTGGYLPLRFGRSAIENATKDRLILSPAS
ncbi:MAG: penicillin acylase family protein [Chloroflexi bacterium]|nr:penicillin acylase family protein [Chloroflexota bacterium]